MNKEIIFYNIKNYITTDNLNEFKIYFNEEDNNNIMDYLVLGIKFNSINIVKYLLQNYKINNLYNNYPLIYYSGTKEMEEILKFTNDNNEIFDYFANILFDVVSYYNIFDIDKYNDIIKIINNDLMRIISYICNIDITNINIKKYNFKNKYDYSYNNINNNFIILKNIILTNIVKNHKHFMLNYVAYSLFKDYNYNYDSNDNSISNILYNYDLYILKYFCCVKNNTKFFNEFITYITIINKESDLHKIIIVYDDHRENELPIILEMSVGKFYINCLHMILSIQNQIIDPYFIIKLFEFNKTIFLQIRDYINDELLCYLLLLINNNIKDAKFLLKIFNRNTKDLYNIIEKNIKYIDEDKDNYYINKILYNPKENKIIYNEDYENYKINKKYYNEILQLLLGI